MMNAVVFEDFDKICRSCLCKNGEMRPIFGSCLDNMLSNVADIEVGLSDGLPELLCVPCVLQVSRAFTFKQQCRRSDQMLRSCLVEFEQFDVPDTEDLVTEESHDEQTISKHIQTNSTLLSTNIILPSTNISEIATSTTSISAEDLNDSVDSNILVDDERKDERTADITVTKFEEYFEDIQLDVANDISLNDSEINTDAIEEPLDGIVSNDLLTETDNKGFENTATESISATLPSIYTTNESTQLKTVSDLSESLRKPLHECPECHKVFAENKILKRHLKIHNPIKPHVCSVCDMSFAESSNLTKHMKKHTGELRNVIGKPNLCSVCGKGFKWASSLSKHMKHHTRHKILNCPYCPKYYVEARSLNIHLRSHTGEKPFKCSHCNKGFTQMGNLEKHIRVHTGEKPFTCPVCNKGFSQSGYVAIHLRIHTGERPYHCEHCGKSFSGSNTLAIHKRTHTGEKPYACKFCDKSFARQETAIIHQRTHTGEKPHICQICSRGFTSSGHLTGHMRSHSGIKTHECKVCQKRFAGSSSLKVHMKTHIDKTIQQQQQQQNFDSKNTVFECEMCKMNIPSTALASTDGLRDYNHEFIDDVLICSNVTSIIDDDKLISDENDSKIILTTVIE